MTINLFDKTVELKFSFKAEMLFETINDKTFTAQTTTEWVEYLFCVIIAQLGDGAVKYDEFLKWLDENPDVIFDFMEWYTETMTEINRMRSKKVEEKVAVTGKKAKK